ncbi:MAG: (E)-4-hydroxy-3-methylbut-2-enyl-diphosphate synthase [Paludibacteraceae bacterium]|nr:(E)-4-hydroxy-3-methylbut-2-enyl-diphosphate synthase [Paludibacteraceae bacterium]
MDDSSRLFLYQRRETIAVKVGNIEIGGDNPIRVQSMANTDTNDIDSSVQQALRIEKVGGELIRFTAQGIKEATNLKQIRENFRKNGGLAPLVADIHFNPQAAFVAAEAVEKVRINPGNFVDRVHTLQRFDYTDEEYQQEIEKIKDKLYPLLDICKAHHTAIRIGVNHGSLSDRILSRYGDTPKGMVESCMEFLRLCVAYDFYNIVISIKASNTVIMVQTVRLLVDTMNKAGMKFPLHLGVTEAGDGEDGRVKSALGIGALLQDGIGDTIRVSLSEAPENEIPVARKLVDYITTTAPIRSCDTVVAKNSGLVDPFVYKRRITFSVDKIGDGQVPVVVSNTNVSADGLSPDYCAKDFQTSIKSVFATISTYDSIKSELDDHTVVVLDSVGYPTSQDGIGGQREFLHRMLSDGLKNPVILRRRYMDSNIEDLQIKAGADYGQFFIDGLVDGIWIEAPQVQEESVVSLMYAILQGSRARVSKTEYISCPSCGRTLFDLQNTLAKIKERTSHLKGLKIGVMGCIVNGPGEMADADYGYVGSARGKVNLYKGQTCLEKAIPQEEAVDRLIQLIKENGDWKDR